MEGKIVVGEENVARLRVVRKIIIIRSTRMMAIKMEKIEAVVRKMIAIVEENISE